jgi:hypothetical protein
VDPLFVIPTKNLTGIYRISFGNSSAGSPLPGLLPIRSLHGRPAVLALTGTFRRHYIRFNRKGTIMPSRRHITARIGDFFDIFGSAVAASSAVRNGRQPQARDLRTLGIDPEQYSRIGR